MKMRQNFQKDNIVYYKGESMRLPEQSKAGYVVIVNEISIDNWIGVKYLNSEVIFGCPIERISQIFMEKKYLENYGFQSEKIDDFITKFKYHIINYGDILIYHSPMFGFCTTENIDTLKFEGQFNAKCFFQKNRCINNINDVINFFIESKVSKTRKEIFFKLFNPDDVNCL